MIIIIIIIITYLLGHFDVLTHKGCKLNLLSHSVIVYWNMPIKKGHWRLQPLCKPNPLSGKTWADYYTQVANRTTACERTWSKPASWNLHSVIVKKRNRWSSTSSRTVQSGRNRDTRYGCRRSQPLTSCRDAQKTSAAPPNSWQHVDWGSKHGWSTAEEEEE